MSRSAISSDSSVTGLDKASPYRFQELRQGLFDLFQHGADTWKFVSLQQEKLSSDMSEATSRPRIGGLLEPGLQHVDSVLNQYELAGGLDQSDRVDLLVQRANTSYNSGTAMTS